MPQRPPSDIMGAVNAAAHSQSAAPVDRIKVCREPSGVLTACRQVLHFERSRFHLYANGIKTVCRLRQCGSPDKPVAAAIFAGPDVLTKWVASDKSGLQSCKGCYSTRITDILGISASDAIASSAGEDDDDEAAVVSARGP